jgi:predicted regulator of Ras-like GTPase activity (Roadblock/LC7/MglB family)
VSFDLARFEQDLRRIPGIKAARVVGEDAPLEIHVLTSTDKSAKQVVRDVQSLAAAAYNLSIDHRIVSVVQTEEELPPEEAPRAPAPEAPPPRVVLNWLMQASQGGAGRIDVGLRWPFGETAGGAQSASSDREARARAAAEASVQALDGALRQQEISVEVDSLVLTQIGSSEALMVKVLYRENGIATPLLGVAQIEDDVASATARALLHALNRKLSAVSLDVPLTK